MLIFINYSERVKAKVEEKALQLSSRCSLEAQGSTRLSFRKIFFSYPDCQVFSAIHLNDKKIINYIINYIKYINLFIWVEKNFEN